MLTIALDLFRKSNNCSITRMNASNMTTVHACSLTTVHACILLIVKECTIYKVFDIVHACSLSIMICSFRITILTELEVNLERCFMAWVETARQDTGLKTILQDQIPDSRLPMGPRLEI